MFVSEKEYQSGERVMTVVASDNRDVISLGKAEYIKTEVPEELEYLGLDCSKHNIKLSLFKLDQGELRYDFDFWTLSEDYWRQFYQAQNLHLISIQQCEQLQELILNEEDLYNDTGFIEVAELVSKIENMN